MILEFGIKEKTTAVSSAEVNKYIFTVPMLTPVHFAGIFNGVQALRSHHHQQESTALYF